MSNKEWLEMSVENQLKWLYDNADKWSEAQITFKPMDYEDKYRYLRMLKANKEERTFTSLS